MWVGDGGDAVELATNNDSLALATDGTDFGVTSWDVRR